MRPWPRLHTPGNFPTPDAGSPVPIFSGHYFSLDQRIAEIIPLSPLFSESFFYSYAERCGCPSTNVGTLGKRVTLVGPGGCLCLMPKIRLLNRRVRP